MKLLPEFPGVDGSWQELTRDSREGSGQEMAGKGPERRYLETVLEPLGSNRWLEGTQMVRMAMWDETELLEDEDMLG